MDANEAAARMFAYEVPEVIGMDLPEFIAPECHDLLSERMLATVADAFELVGRRKDGSTFPVEIFGRRISHGAGILAVAGLRDITERKRAEEALRERQERLSLLVESSQDGIHAYDDDMRFTLWNPAMERISGIEADDVIGRFPFEVFPFLKEVEEAEAFKQTLEDEPSRRSEMPYSVPETGREGYFESSHVPLRDAQGGVVGGMAIIRDITERKQADDALRASESKFRLLAENARDIIFRYRVTDPRGFEYVSPAATIITGYTPEMWCEDADFSSKIVHPDDRGALLQAMREVQTDVLELRWVHKDGSILWGEQRNVPIYDPGGRLVAIEGIIRDITGRKRMEEELREAREELEGRVERQMLRRNPYGLTFRELTVLHLIAAGRADKEVAAELSIALPTAKKHVANIRDKMDVRSRTEAGIRALKEGLLG